MNGGILCVVTVLVLMSFSFATGIYFGKHIAETSIKSELIWYNQYVLKQAIDEMKQGRLDQAEKKILSVNERLNKMKNIHNQSVEVTVKPSGDLSKD